MTRGIVAAALALALLAACSAGSGGRPGSTGGSPALPSPDTRTAALTILAAASLGPALDQIEPAFERSHPGATLTISTDSSAALATQIEQGAPADVFLSADMTNARRVVDAGLSAGDPVVFATNELTIIAPADNPAGLTRAFDLAKPGVRVVAAGDEVPITAYAVQVVDNLAAESGAPADFAARYAANVVSKEDNVAAVRAKIELGEGDAAIVYVTDAVAARDVATIDVPASANVRARYAGVVVEGGSRVAAHAFLDWLAGPHGRSILAEFGFLPAPAR